MAGQVRTAKIREGVPYLVDTDEVTSDLVTTERVDINDFSAILTKTSDQTISANTDTTPDWDSQDVDTDIYTYNASPDDIDVSVAGDYRIDVHFDMQSVSDQDNITVRSIVNGSIVRNSITRASGTRAFAKANVLLKDLSVDDTIRIDVRTPTQGTLNGVATQSYAMISKEA